MEPTEEADRDHQAEFDGLIQEFDTARRQAVEQDRVGTAEAIAQAQTAKENWRVVKERIKDLLEEWVEIGSLTRREP